MKWLKVKLFLINFSIIFERISECFSNKIEVKEEKSSFEVAANEIARKIFVDNFTYVRFISSSAEKLQLKSSEIVTEIIKSFESKLEVAIEEADLVYKFENKRELPTIFIIDSFESFQKLSNQTAFEKFKIGKLNLVILINGMFKEIDKIMKKFWSIWVHKISVLSVGEDGKISLQTFFPFSNENCGNDTKLVEINRFNSTKLRWENENFFPEKFKNLHSCPLKVAALSTSIPSVIVSRSKNNSKVFSGHEIDLVNEIVKNFNLSIRIEDFDLVGTLYDNGSITPNSLWSSLHRGENEIAFGYLSLQFDRTKFFSESKSIMSIPMVIVVPPAKFISPFEKLIRPFTATIWIILLTLFAVGFLVITILQKTSQSAYNFVVGRGVNYPFLNMLIAFFGLSQHKLPKRNFARYLLMNFLLFCLVIRCLYQGKLFIMLQSEMREKEIETIDEMIERKMTFYAYESLARRTVGFKFAPW
jgi:hypothetical protein